MKNKETIFDCENTKGVVYPENKCSGLVKFINCNDVTGIEFDLAMKVTDIDISNLLQLKYLNIHRTSIKKITVPATCMVYCKNSVIIYRK